MDPGERRFCSNAVRSQATGFTHLSRDFDRRDDSRAGTKFGQLLREATTEYGSLPVVADAAFAADGIRGQASGDLRLLMVARVVCGPGRELSSSDPARRWHSEQQ